MSLEEFEAIIDQCERLEYTTWDFEEHEVTGVEAAVDCLYSVWGDLRRICWSQSYREWANALKARCRSILSKLSEEHDLMWFGEPDRWPAGANCDTHPAVH